MKINQLIGLLFIAAALTYCTTPEASTEVPAEYGNPPAEGFKMEASDEKAMAIADEVMEAMGGRQAWDTTRFIQWTFFGRRTLLWDKQTGNVRVDVPGDSTIYLVNINDETGKVQLKGQDISASDTLQTYVERGKSIWINDSYWLVMPFKLKDSGVTLKYIGQDTMNGGIKADVLELTFAEVGRTPDNKYKVYVDLEDRMVKQWDFFSKYDDPAPRMSTPWQDYKPYGALMLSGNRGRGQLTDIKVLNEVPETAFTDFAAIDL
ncbi:MAG: hypothetical protein AAF705_17935 [Bacteroidota bacterium]